MRVRFCKGDVTEASHHPPNLDAAPLRSEETKEGVPEEEAKEELDFRVWSLSSGFRALLPVFLASLPVL